MMKKKVAILATYVGVINRGAESFVIELGKYLREYYELDIYAMGINKDIEKNIIPVQVKKPSWLCLHEWIYQQSFFYRFFCNKLYWLNPSEIFQFYFNKKVYQEHLLKKHYDLVFVNNGIWGAKYASKLRALQGVPFMCTGHGGRGPGERLILRTHPDLYVALGNDQAIWARKIWNKVTRIYNGVDFKKFSLPMLYKKEKNLVLLVGALTKYKRHKLAIDAVARLSNVQLLILGAGELEKEIRAYGHKKLGSRFMLKSVPYTEIMMYYHKAQVFTLPSFNETCAISYFEALASGLPVVAPNDHIRQEMIGSAGVLCECESDVEYAAAIQRALDTDWGNLPQEQAVKFDWQIIAEKYMEVMDELMYEDK